MKSDGCKKNTFINKIHWAITIQTKSNQYKLDEKNWKEFIPIYNQPFFFRICTRFCYLNASFQNQSKHELYAPQR
jgi:hypothetical protein